MKRKQIKIKKKDQLFHIIIGLTCLSAVLITIVGSVVHEHGVVGIFLRGLWSLIG